jgi:ferredoxin
MKEIKKIIEQVWIEPGCISCGACAFLAPDVFEVLTISQIKPAVNLEQQSENIILAARSCPVSVIKYTENVTAHNNNSTPELKS